MRRAALGLGLALLLDSGSARAFELTLLPGSEQEAIAGGVLGFGCRIRNTDATRWLVS